MSILHLNVLFPFLEKPFVTMKELALGNTVELRCSATGNPPPLVSWQKKESDGSFVPFPGGDGQWELSASVIKVELSEDTYGTYRCVAKNSQGSDQEDEELSPGELLCHAEIYSAPC